MITEDEVMRLLEQADPARRPDAAVAADPAAYLHALHGRTGTMSPRAAAPERRPRRRTAGRPARDRQARTTGPSPGGGPPL